MQNKEQIIKLLTQTGIPYTLVEHSAVYTIFSSATPKSATTIFWSPRTTNRSS